LERLAFSCQLSAFSYQLSALLARELATMIQLKSKIGTGILMTVATGLSVAALGQFIGNSPLSRRGRHAH
jgi:hypothetical protein